jgi:hypothetical protein
MSEFGELMVLNGYNKNYTNDNIYFYTKHFNKYSIAVYEYDFTSMRQPYNLHPYNGPDYRYDVRTEFNTSEDIYVRVSFGLENRKLNKETVDFFESKCFDMFVFSGGV